MAKVWTGIGVAALMFILVGVLIPVGLEHYRPVVSKYVQLPSPENVLIAFVFFGALFAVTSFLANGYSKGDLQWLVGKIGGGFVGVGFFAYLLLYLPDAAISSITSGVQARGLLVLVYCAIGLSYVHLMLDFFQARRAKRRLTP